jgi:hypothetical protein
MPPPPYHPPTLQLPKLLSFPWYAEHTGKRLAPGFCLRQRFDGTSLRISTKQQTVFAGQFKGLYDFTVVGSDPASRGHEQPRLHHTVVTKRNADSAVRAQETSLFRSK